MRKRLLGTTLQPFNVIRSEHCGYSQLHTPQNAQNLHTNTSFIYINSAICFKDKSSSSGRR